VREEAFDGRLSFALRAFVVLSLVPAVRSENGFEYRCLQASNASRYRASRYGRYSSHGSPAWQSDETIR